MRRRLGIVTVLGLAFGAANAAIRAEVGEERRPRPLILAHYMPWFESKATSGHWVWHWTMGHFDPERVDSNGRRDIASHDYPLIGPYDSDDPDVLEYHTLLMKVAGIDGVIADWYGSEEFNDYAMIHRRTVSLFDAIKRRGLKSAICYEDRVLKAMVDRGVATPAQALAHGKTHLRFCEENWFKEPTYVTCQDKPLLLVLGPEYLDPTQWKVILMGMRQPPALFTLHERRPPAIGSFAWSPMWAARDGKLDSKELDAYLDRFSRQDGLKMAAAFPGFHDIYETAGVQPSHGYLDPRDGETFRHTLGRALASESPFVQVATWNDFGEGTCVEPSREYGYRYLETLQDARRGFIDEPFRYRPEDLRLPQRIYRLRKRVAPSSTERKLVDEAVDLLSNGDGPSASRRLDELERAARNSQSN